MNKKYIFILIAFPLSLQAMKRKSIPSPFASIASLSQSDINGILEDEKTHNTPFYNHLLQFYETHFSQQLIEKKVHDKPTQPSTIEDLHALNEETAAQYVQSNPFFINTSFFSALLTHKETAPQIIAKILSEKNLYKAIAQFTPQQAGEFVGRITNFDHSSLYNMMYARLQQDPNIKDTILQQSPIYTNGLFLERIATAQTQGIEPSFNKDKVESDWHYSLRTSDQILQKLIITSPTPLSKGNLAHEVQSLVAAGTVMGNMKNAPDLSQIYVTARKNKKLDNLKKPALAVGGIFAFYGMLTIGKTLLNYFIK
ncbi:MAG: hypothetical protein WA432_04095 [Candidatus Babeliaceae bacterium]